MNIEQLRYHISLVQAHKKNRQTEKVLITLPNTNGKFENFEIVEASNFEPELQAKFPEIRAYSGKGVEDKGAILKLSISPYGIQTMVLRIDGNSEFMKPFSENRDTYALYKSTDSAMNSEWTCSTYDKKITNSLKKSVRSTQKSSAGQLKTMRLVQSCTGEYSQYHATLVGQPASIAISLAAFNNTMTRCNSVYEKDLGLHLNLIANTTSVIYLNSGTDPLWINFSKLQWRTTNHFNQYYWRC